MSIDENEVLIIGRIGRIEKPKKKEELDLVSINEYQPVDNEDNENDGFGVDGGNNKGGSKTKRKPIKYSNSKTRKDRNNRFMNGGAGKEFNFDAFVQQVLDKYFGLDKKTNECEKHFIDSFECKDINHADNLELKTIIPIIYNTTEIRNKTIDDNTKLVKYFKKIFNPDHLPKNNYLIAQMHHDINNNKLNGIIGIIQFKKNQKNQSIEIKQIERNKVHNNTIHVITSTQLYDPFSNSVVEIIAYSEGSIMNLIQNIYVTRSPILRKDYLTQFLQAIPEDKRASLQELLKIKQVNNFQQKMKSIEDTIKKNHKTMKSDLDKLNGVIQTLDDEAKTTNSSNIKNHLNDRNLKDIIIRYTDEKKYQDILNSQGKRELLSELKLLSFTIKEVEIKSIDKLYIQNSNEIPNKITNRITNKIIEKVTKLDNDYKKEVKQKAADARSVKAKKEAEAEAEKKNKIAADKVAKATKVKAKGTGNTIPLDIQDKLKPPTLIPINIKKINK
jgi:hypothetical protein